jgi:hypothetical protein
MLFQGASLGSLGILDGTTSSASWDDPNGIEPTQSIVMRTDSACFPPDYVTCFPTPVPTPAPTPAPTTLAPTPAPTTLAPSTLAPTAVANPAPLIGILVGLVAALIGGGAVLGGGAAVGIDDIGRLGKGGKGGSKGIELDEWLEDVVEYLDPPFKGKKGEGKMVRRERRTMRGRMLIRGRQ